MTLPRWPLGRMRLPVQHGPVDDAIRFENARGRRKSRPRTSVREHFLKLTQRLAPTEVAILQAFHDDTLEDGALPFLWLDPIDAAQRVEVEREMVFHAPPAFDVQSHGWTLATLDLRYRR